MDSDILPSPPGPLTNPVPQSFWHHFFLNDRGMRSGWRLLIYVALVAGFGTISNLMLRVLLHPARGVFSVRMFFLSEIMNFAVVFGAALIMAKFEGRPAGVFGLPAQGAFGKLFCLGCLFGLVEVTALIGLIAVFGGYSFGELALHGRTLLQWAVVWALFFVFVGLFEEFLFRGYTQFTLADGIGFWPAAILLSTGFGAVHLFNPGEGWVGAAGVVMIGLIFAFGLRRTGNLWLVVGWHAAFDFGETFLYSVPNSGIVVDGHLSNATLHGPVWLTGGSVGPEGSVFSFLTMAISAVVIQFLFPAKKTEAATN